MKKIINIFIVLISLSAFSQITDKNSNDYLNRVDRFTEKKQLQSEDKKELEYILKQIVLERDKINTIDLYDAFLESYSQNRKLYRHVFKRLTPDEKKPVEELFLTFDELLKNGND